MFVNTCVFTYKIVRVPYILSVVVEINKINSFRLLNLQNKKTIQDMNGTVTEATKVWRRLKRSEKVIVHD